MFFLRKERRDTEDGVEMVVVHWATTRRDQQPNWKRAHPTAVMFAQPTTYPVVRSCSLWVSPPVSQTRLLTMNTEAHSRFFLHTFCEVTQWGRTWNTEATVQELRAETITYSDTTGEYTQAFVYYSLDGFTHGSRVPMRVEGLPKRYQCPPALPEHSANDKDYYQWAKRSHLIARLPLPRVFRGQIWGPVGTRALYSIHLHRQWTYNPFADGGMWVLQDGRPWEIQL